MIISSIEIENIKGIQHLLIKQPIYPNRPNILVAPNGFGKSSIAIAFRSLNNGHLSLKPEHYYQEIMSNHPSIKISINDGTVLSADECSDTISSNYSIHVANNALIPTAKAKHFGKVTTAKASLDIEPTVIIKTIPQTEFFGYSLINLKREFGDNGKVLTDISQLYENETAITRIEHCVDFHIFKLKTYCTKIDNIINEFNLFDSKTTALVIKTSMRKSMNFRDICPEFTALMNRIETELSIDNDCDGFLVTWQYLATRKHLGTKFGKALAYLRYLRKKQLLDETLNELNPVRDRFDIKSCVKNRSLVINWPKAHQISNGQRDTLVFVSKLLECKFKESKNCILIIDEFFDYLDDANLVVFQYYVSTLIDSYKKDKRIIFPILLTHLDPNYLKHFCFDDKKLNICYLKDSKAKIRKCLSDLVNKRDDESIKENVDKYYFHFYPNLDNINLTNAFKNLSLNSDWSKPTSFKKKIERECRRYWYEDSLEYDPLSVCFSVRIRIEENVYNQLQKDEHKREFIATHSTKEKLHYAKSLGITIPETYFLLGIVYNHPLHSIDNNTAKSLALKLDNAIIKQMIKNLWSSNQIIATP